MELICIRHPEPLVPPHRIYGASDVDLKPGWEALIHRRAAEILECDAKPGIILSSDLIRCRQPATLLASLIGADLKVDAGFGEIDWGEWEGQDRNDLFETDPAYRHWTDNWQTDRPPGGESLMDFTYRVQSCWKSIASEIVSQDYPLLLGHAGVIRVLSQLQAAEQGIAPDEMFNRSIGFGEMLRISLPGSLSG